MNLAEQLSEIIYFGILRLGIPCFILPKVIVSYFMYFVTDAGRDAFDLPFGMWQVIHLQLLHFRFSSPLIFHCIYFLDQNLKNNWRLPFDWKHPSGYFVAICLQYFMLIEVLAFLACAIALVLEFFLLAFSFTKDMRNHLRSFNQMIKTDHSEADVSEIFTKFVSFHTPAKELSNIFNSKKHPRIPKCKICSQFSLEKSITLRTLLKWLFWWILWAAQLLYAFVCC